METGGQKWGVCVFAAGSPKALAGRKIRKSYHARSSDRVRQQTTSEMNVSGAAHLPHIFYFCITLFYLGDKVV